MMPEKNQTFVSTSCLPGTESLFSRISTYIKSGFRYIEIGAGVFLDEQNINLNQFFNKNYRFLIHNYFPPPPVPFVLNLASSNASIQKKSISLIEKAISLSAQVQASFYSIHGGFITDPVSFGKTSYILPPPQNPQEKEFAFNRFTSTFKKVLDFSQRSNVNIIIENNVCTSDLKGKLLLQNGDEFIELFKIIPSENCGILLDTGHLNVTANTYNYDPMDFVDKTLDHIEAIHLHGNNGVEDLHEPIGPDSWIMDFLHRSEIIELPIVIEARFHSMSELKCHVNWLNSELGRG